MPFLLFALLALYLLAGFTHLLQCPFLRFAGVSINEIHIGQGKRLASFGSGRTQVLIGLLPTGFSTNYDLDEFASRPLFLRVALILIPPLLLLLTGLALLGPERGWHHLLTGFRQYFEGPFHPQAVGQVLVGKLETLYRYSPVQAIGVFAMKLAAISLLPFGPTTGMAVMEFVPRHRREDRGPQMFILSGVLLVLACQIGWAFILILHALKS